MTDKLTEIKSKLQEATDLIKEYELLEEARRRGFVNGAKFNCASTIPGICIVKEPLAIWNDNHSNKGNVYCQKFNGAIYIKKENKWAEIIPEEEKKDSLIASSLPYSLHDQIREGGWGKVLELAGSEYNNVILEQISNISTIKAYHKITAYTHLLALSKVLNEGKEREQFIYIPKCRNNRLHKECAQAGEWEYQNIFEFYDPNDCDFALDFAEKEWKIFYNSNQ